MVASGLTDTGTDPVTAIVDLAIEMRKKTWEVFTIDCTPLQVCTISVSLQCPCAPNHPQQVSIGVHTGPVVTAVLDSDRKTSHYSMFDETFNIAKIMESTGTPNKIHISDTTYQ